MEDMIKALQRLGPDETLVVRVDRDLSPQAVARVREAILATGMVTDASRVLVMGAELDIETVRLALVNELQDLLDTVQTALDQAITVARTYVPFDTGDESVDPFVHLTRLLDADVDARWRDHDFIINACVEAAEQAHTWRGEHAAELPEPPAEGFFPPEQQRQANAHAAQTREQRHAAKMEQARRMSELEGG